MTAGTSPVGLNPLTSRLGLSEGASLLYGKHEALADEWRQEVDRRHSSESIGDGSVSPAPPGFGNRQEHSTNFFSVSCPPGIGSNRGESSPFSGRKSLSSWNTFEHQSLDGRIVSASGRLRPIGAAAGNIGGIGINRPSTAVSTPTNPQQWLENIALRQSKNANGGGGTAALESLSPSLLPLPSNSRVSTVGTGGGSGFTCAVAGEAVSPGLGDSLRPLVEGRVSAVGTCPAADCPANGDCLPGATPEMLVYEVNFKRATRTFLPGENLDHKSISCGTLLKVRGVTECCCCGEYRVWLRCEQERKGFTYGGTNRTCR